MVDYNSFILPRPIQAYLDTNGVEKRRYSAMYPVRPQNVVYMTDNTGTLYVKMRFNRFAGDGVQEITVPYADVIHIRYSYGANEMFGGDAGGRPDRRALLKTLDLNNRLLDGVAKGVEASYGINGVVSYRGVINAEATRAAVVEFENKLRDPNNRAGTLVMDDSSTYTPISINAKLVDKDTLEFIESKILRTMGVSAAILSGDYTKAQYEAFYQAEIEPLVLKFGRLSPGVFSLKENYPMAIRSFFIRVTWSSCPRQKSSKRSDSSAIPEQFMKMKKGISLVFLRSRNSKTSGCNH